MTELNGILYLFCPRFGTQQRYSVLFGEDSFQITQGPSSASCRVQDGEYVWSGKNADFDNPLLNMLIGDDIHAPSMLPSYLQEMWRLWKTGAITAQDVQLFLDGMASWIEATTKSKPTGGLWDRLG